jgi:hypothetical protein
LSWLSSTTNNQVAAVARVWDRGWLLLGYRLGDEDEHNIYADMPERQPQSAAAEAMAMLQAAKENLKNKKNLPLKPKPNQESSSNISLDEKMRVGLMPQTTLSSYPR